MSNEQPQAASEGSIGQSASTGGLERMGEHAELMADANMTRGQYLAAMRKQQPIDELRRKAEKSARRKGRLWTQEQVDLISAEAVEMLTKFVACDESL